MNKDFMNVIFRMRLLFRISIVIGMTLLALLVVISTELQAFRITPDSIGSYGLQRVDDGILLLNPGLKAVIILADAQGFGVNKSPPLVGITPYEAIMTLIYVHFQEGKNASHVDIFLTYPADIIYDEKYYRVVLYVDAPIIRIVPYVLLVSITTIVLIIIPRTNVNNKISSI